jgi:hypothetical protein
MSRVRSRRVIKNVANVNNKRIKQGSVGSRQSVNDRLLLGIRCHILGGFNLFFRVDSKYSTTTSDREEKAVGPTMAGEALNSSSNLLVANVSSLSECLSTTVFPSRLVK